MMRDDPGTFPMYRRLRETMDTRAPNSTDDPRIKVFELEPMDKMTPFWPWTLGFMFVLMLAGAVTEGSGWIKETGDLAGMMAIALVVAGMVVWTVLMIRRAGRRYRIVFDDDEVRVPTRFPFQRPLVFRYEEVLEIRSPKLKHKVYHGDTKTTVSHSRLGQWSNKFAGNLLRRAEAARRR